jgi:hypothetical protein
MYPDWNASRKNLSLFVLRAHNTVNIRQVSKPVLSVDEALAQLRMHLPEDKAAIMRQSYIVHIRAEWSRNLSMEGVTAAKYIRELILAETEYWGKRGFSWDDIESLVRTESIGPLPSREKPKFSMGVQPPRQPAPRTITGPSSRPRFSFLSR